MIGKVYVEKEVIKHPRTQSILKRLNKEQDFIVIDRWGEIFNRKNQNFRLQKKYLPLILARKLNNFVLPLPISHKREAEGYYFSPVLNCLFDCKYCFLQGMFNSAAIVIFVNYEDFASKIKIVIENTSRKTLFSASYDNDALALEHITEMASFFVKKFEELPSNTTLELRTKSAQIKKLLNISPPKNSVISFSLSPERVYRKLEKGTANVTKRLNAIKKLQLAGWRVAITLDPIIYYAGWEQDYKQLVDTIVREISMEKLDYVNVGILRFPKPFFKKIKKLYPTEPFLSFPPSLDEYISYPSNITKRMLSSIQTMLRPISRLTTVYLNC